MKKKSIDEREKYSQRRWVKISVNEENDCEWKRERNRNLLSRFINARKCI